MPPPSPKAQLERFIGKFTPEVAAHTRAVLKKMRHRLPGALELVYDNYNALAIAFSPTERTSEVIFSIAVYPRWVSLFFAHATDFPDPQRLLQGSGSSVRHIVLEELATLDLPAVKQLMAVAMKRAVPGFDLRGKSRIVIKSISANQRPRRPPKRRLPATR